MDTIRLSVIICSYNPEKEYLNRTLTALKHQTLDKNQWELLLVDNNSEKLLSESFDLGWHPNARHLIERKQGLTAARLNGIREAGGEMLIFVDDDNILSEDYLETACTIADNDPVIGAFGGSIMPEFEIEPDPKLLKHTGKLAIRTVEQDNISNSYSGHTQPYGAGLVIRKKIAATYADNIKGNTRETLDRVGQSLGSAGDIDMALTSIDMGYKNGLFKNLALIHIIPKERLTLDYLGKIRKGVNYSGMLLRYYRFNKKPPKPYPFPIQMFKHLYKRVTLNKTDYTMYMASEKARTMFYNTIRKSKVNDMD